MVRGHGSNRGAVPHQTLRPPGCRRPSQLHGPSRHNRWLSRPQRLREVHHLCACSSGSLPRPRERPPSTAGPTVTSPTRSTPSEPSSTRPSFHPGRTAQDHLRIQALAGSTPLSRLGPVLGVRRSRACCQPAGGHFLPRDAPAPGSRHRAAVRPPGADPRRAGQRARPRGRALAPESPPGPGHGGTDGARLQPYPR